jgi:crotonobetainyl-CoA:carnitine CoA-transferase CaiB-like acyl-CoA transferase
VARGLRVELPHASGVSAPAVASPLRLSKTPVRYRHAAPPLGADTDEILHRLQLNKGDLT